ncbi:MAG: hypothetical protein AAFR74_01170 [Pseudomonadota bacterium]
MNLQQFLHILVDTMASQKAQTLALSKGGWEGWLQCEMWAAVSQAGVSIERELQYPDSNTFCDLVCQIDNNPTWIELKAFGIFQKSNSNKFLDSFAIDVGKLDRAPDGVSKLAILVVPKSIGDVLIHLVSERWPAVTVSQTSTMYLCYIKF